MRARQMVGLALAGVLAAVTAGCGGDDDGGSMKVSGNCGLGENKLAVEKVLPTAVTEKLVGDGDYKAIGGLIVRDGKLPAAYDGECALQQSDSGQDAIRLGLVNSSDPRYTDAKETIASGDLDGFVKVDETTYVLPDGSDGARGVAILPDRIVVLRVLRPAEGIDVVKETGAAVAEVADRVASLTPPPGQ